MTTIDKSFNLLTHYEHKFDFQTLKFLLQKNKKMFITIFLFVWLLTSVYSLIGYKPSYVSSGMVMIKDTALTAKYVTADSYEMTAAQSTSSVMNTMGLLKTNVFMEELWNFFKTNHPNELSRLKIKNFVDWERFYGGGNKIIKYSNLPGTDLISMDFNWGNPQIAKEGLDDVLNTFREASLTINRTEQHERRLYLTQQINEIQQKLSTLQDQDSQYKTQHRVVNSEEESANLAKEKLSIKSNLVVIQAEANGKHSQVSNYSKLLGGMNTQDALRATALGRNETMSKLQNELYTTQTERASLLKLYTEQSTKVQEVESHIAQLETNIKEETARSLGSSKGSNLPSISDETRGHAVDGMVSASTEAQQLESQNHVLGSYLHEIESRARELPHIENVLSNYNLEETSLRNSLQTLKEKELDAQLKESQSLSNVFIVDEPRVPLDASFPRLPHLLLFDLFLGLVCATLALLYKYNQNCKNHSSIQSSFSTSETINEKKTTENGYLIQHG